MFHSHVDTVKMVPSWDCERNHAELPRALPGLIVAGKNKKAKRWAAVRIPPGRNNKSFISVTCAASLSRSSLETFCGESPAQSAGICSPIQSLSGGGPLKLDNKAEATIDTLEMKIDSAGDCFTDSYLINPRVHRYHLHTAGKHTRTC